MHQGLIQLLIALFVIASCSGQSSTTTYHQAKQRKPRVEDGTLEGTGQPVSPVVPQGFAPQNVVQQPTTLPSPVVQAPVQTIPQIAPAKEEEKEDDDKDKEDKEVIDEKPKESNDEEQFLIRGTIENLLGEGLVLQNNKKETIEPFDSGSFEFPEPYPDKTRYKISVKTQPTHPIQTCTVNSGFGAIKGKDVEEIIVNCTIPSFTLGGTVNGLAGNGLLLINNGGDDLSIVKSGEFHFLTSLKTESSYKVSIKAQPKNPIQECKFTGSSEGRMGEDHFVGLAINCVTQKFQIGGQVAGLLGSGLKLKLGSGEELDVSQNLDGGKFTFPTTFVDSSTYEVSVVSQPTSPTQVCSISQNKGTILGANATNIVVTCSTKSFKVKVDLVSSFNANGLVLKNNGTDSLTLMSNVGVFELGIADGAPYEVKIEKQPVDQTCTLKDSKGVIAGADSKPVLIICCSKNQKPNEVGACNFPVAFTEGLRINDNDEFLQKNDPSPTRIHVGDFNGDGKSDILRTGNDPRNNKVYLSNGTNFENGVSILGDEVLQNANSMLYLADFNADGKTDLLHIETSPENSQNLLYYGVVTSAGFSFTRGLSVPITDVTSDGRVRIHLGDFNGDKMMDVLRTSDDYRLNKLFLATPVGIQEKNTLSLIGGTPQLSNGSVRLHLGDFNGDGKTDLLKTTDADKVELGPNLLFLSVGDGFDQGTPVFLNGTANEVMQLFNKTVRIHIGDFNGDGKDDVLRTDNANSANTVYFAFANATGFEPGTPVRVVLKVEDQLLESNLTIDEQGTGRKLDDHGKKRVALHLGDFNGDKKIDLLRTWDEDTGKTRNRVFLSTGSNFLDAGTLPLPDGNLQDSAGHMRIHLGDFNGDKKLDFVRTGDELRFQDVFFSTLDSE